MPNKLSQFWQELKRRNVVRVITVYAGAAFVIIELINNITEPLRLPEWTPTLVIVLLAIGLPVAIIFSWIYDIHPEGGIVKTAPAQKVKEEDIQKSSNSWKIASYISFVVIVGLIVLNVIPRAKRSEKLAGFETSIAVLPFENMSSNEEDQYLGGAFCDEIIMKLQKIKAFDRVLSRTSTMQYEKDRPTIPEIAEKLNVNYIVEGSIQRSQQNVRIRVQVIRAYNEDHIWGETYDREWNDIFSIQDEIAFQVARQLQLTLTPDEIDLIEEIPTTSLTAYDLYQKGREEFYRNVGGYYYSIFSSILYGSDMEAFELAKDYYNEALKYDSTFAQAYTGLARIYWSSNHFDTVRVLLDKALSFDPGLAEAHTLYGRYYNRVRDTERALREVDRALSLNPNDWEAYSVRAGISSDYINKISNRQKAVQLGRGPDELPNLLFELGNTYMMIGFYDKAADIFEDKLELDRNNKDYISVMLLVEGFTGNVDRYAELLEQFEAYDSISLAFYMAIFEGALFKGDKERALKYGKIWVDGMKASGISWGNSIHRMGAYYSLLGLEEEANYYYDLQIEQGSSVDYYNLASAYAAKGETEKALENLRIWATSAEIDAMMLWFIRMDSNFNPIRDNPEFQQILGQYEAEFQAEHERVRLWLEENDML